MITGKPSATAAHVECGMINAGGSIHNADRGHYPVLMMSGYPPSAESGSVPGARDAGIQWYQQIRDQGELVRQYMRWDHKLASYDNPGTVVTRAVQVMLSEPQGPAYLAIPREAAMRPMDGAHVPAAGPAAAGAQPPVADRALAAPGREVAARRRAAGDLRLARRPRPVRGAGAGRAGRDARRAGHGRRLPREHPGRPSAGASAAARCPGRRRMTDCFLILDMLVPWPMATYRPARERAHHHAGDRPDSSHDADLRVPDRPGDQRRRGRVDPAAARRGAVGDDAPRSASAAGSAAQRLQRRRPAAARGGDQGCRGRARARATSPPSWLSYQVGQSLDPETIIVNELVNTPLFNRTRPGTQFNAGGSSLGWAAPAAVGAKVAAPDRQIVCCTGDGSWMFGNPQVVTWASKFHKAPVLFIISNNRGYSTGTTQVLRSYPEGYAAKAQDVTGGWFDPCPNYSGEAAASGAYGEKVTDPERGWPGDPARTAGGARGRAGGAGHVDAEARHGRALGVGWETGFWDASSRRTDKSSLAQRSRTASWPR